MSDGSRNKELTVLKLNSRSFTKLFNKLGKSGEKVDFFYVHDLVDKAIVGNSDYIFNKGKVAKVGELFKNHASRINPGHTHFFSPICMQKRLKICRTLEKENVILKLEDSSGEIDYSLVESHIIELKRYLKELK